MEYLFVERQRFNQWWLWLLLILVNGLGFAMVANLLIAQPTNIGLWLALVSIVFVTALIVFFRLETRINEQGIEVRFFPFHLSFIKISWEQLQKIEVREYSPISEYGGWGIRYGRSGKAYNVSGNTGIQLTFKDGKSLLIGTNKKEEAEVILKNIKGIIYGDYTLL